MRNLGFFVTKDVCDGEKNVKPMEGIDRHLILSIFSRGKQQDIMQWYKNKWKQGKNKKGAQIWENFKTSPKNVGCYMQEKAVGSIEQDICCKGETTTSLKERRVFNKIVKKSYFGA